MLPYWIIRLKEKVNYILDIYSVGYENIRMTIKVVGIGYKSIKILYKYCVEFL